MLTNNSLKVIIHINKRKRETTLKETENSTKKDFLTFLFAIPVAFAVDYYQAFVLAIGWNEFALRVFDLPTVTATTVFALDLLFSLAKGKQEESKADEVFKKLITKTFLITFVWALLSVLQGL